MQSINIRFYFLPLSIHCATVNQACALIHMHDSPILPATVTLHFFSSKKKTLRMVSLTNYTASIQLEMSVWYSNVSLWGSNNRTEPAGDTENITSRKMHVLHLSVMCFQFPTFMNSHIADIWVRFFSQCWIWAFWLKRNVRNMGLRLSWAFVLRV